MRVDVDGGAVLLCIMREADHFYSELSGIARRGANHSSTDDWKEAPKRAFSRLVDPIVGPVPAEELFRHWLGRHGSGDEPRFEKLGHIASFILGDYDDAAMDLDADDWSAIRDIVSAEAEEMDLDELTRLMTDLVSRGALR